MCCYSLCRVVPLSRPKADSSPGLCLGGFLVTILRRGMAHQRIQQVLSDVGDLVDSLSESFLVGLGRLGGTADLAHILQRGGLHFCRRSVWFEVMESPDIPAHNPMLTMGSAAWGGVPIDALWNPTIGFSYWIFRMSRRPLGMPKSSGPNK